MTNSESSDKASSDHNRTYMENLHGICSDRAKGNFRASEKYARRAGLLTIANLLASIFILFFVSNDGALAVVNALLKPISTTIGYESPKSGGALGNLIIGILGTLAVATAAIQYVLKYEERLMVHKYYGADYENLARKIQRLLAGNQADPETVHKTNRQMNYLARHAPVLSSHIMREVWYRRLFLYLFGPFAAQSKSSTANDMKSDLNITKA